MLLAIQVLSTAAAAVAQHSVLRGIRQRASKLAPRILLIRRRLSHGHIEVAIQLPPECQPR